MRHRAGIYLVVILSFATLASAGPFADSLGKCLVSSTTSAEKTTLVQWVFATIALHPGVQSLASVTPERRTQLNKETAHLFERLLTEACRTETIQAVKYEGTGTIEMSFGLLGQVAMRELFADPKVAAGLEEFAKSVDPAKIKPVLDLSKQ
jgi:hypothetical protein